MGNHKSRCGPNSRVLRDLGLLDFDTCLSIGRTSRDMGLIIGCILILKPFDFQVRNKNTIQEKKMKRQNMISWTYYIIVFHLILGVFSDHLLINNEDLCPVLGTANLLDINAPHQIF